MCLLFPTRASFPGIDSTIKKENKTMAIFCYFLFDAGDNLVKNYWILENYCFHSRDTKVNCFWLDGGVYKFPRKSTWGAIYLYNICGNHLVWAFPRFILKCKGEAPKPSTSKKVSNQTISLHIFIQQLSSRCAAAWKRHQIHKNETNQFWTV